MLIPIQTMNGAIEQLLHINRSYFPTWAELLTTEDTKKLASVERPRNSRDGIVHTRQLFFPNPKEPTNIVSVMFPVKGDVT